MSYTKALLVDSCGNPIDLASLLMGEKDFGVLVMCHKDTGERTVIQGVRTQDGSATEWLDADENVVSLDDYVVCPDLDPVFREYCDSVDETVKYLLVMCKVDGVVDPTKNQWVNLSTNEVTDTKPATAVECVEGKKIISVEPMHEMVADEEVAEPYCDTENGTVIFREDFETPSTNQGTGLGVFQTDFDVSENGLAPYWGQMYAEGIYRTFPGGYVPVGPPDPDIHFNWLPYAPYSTGHVSFNLQPSAGASSLRALYTEVELTEGKCYTFRMDAVDTHEQSVIDSDGIDLADIGIVVNGAVVGSTGPIGAGTGTDQGNVYEASFVAQTSGAQTLALISNNSATNGNDIYMDWIELVEADFIEPQPELKCVEFEKVKCEATDGTITSRYIKRNNATGVEEDYTPVDEEAVMHGACSSATVSETSGVEDECKPKNCVCKRETVGYGGIDNGGLFYQDTGKELTLNFSDGSSTTTPLPDHTVTGNAGWDELANNMAAAILASMPNSGAEVYCNDSPFADCTPYAQAPVPLNMFARYTGYKFCEGDIYVVSASYKTDQSAGGSLPVDTALSEPVTFQECTDCDGNVTATLADGSEYTPAGCAKFCDEPVEEIVKDEIAHGFLQGCDSNDGTPIVGLWQYNVTTGENSVVFHNANTADPHTLVGIFQDCEEETPILADYEFVVECVDGVKNVVLYSIIDGVKTEVDRDVTSDACSPYDTTCGGNVWTIFSKLPNPHPDFPNATFIGNLGAGSIHPVENYAINGWNVFAICATEQPATDSNGHEWISGAPSSNSATVTYVGTPNADPTCEGGVLAKRTKGCNDDRRDNLLQQIADKPDPTSDNSDVIAAISAQTAALIAENCTENDVPLTHVSGTGNVPAGLKSVTINNISGITVVNGQFALGTGRRLDSISFGTDRGNCKNETLPAYTLSGGTWQWIGLRE